MGDMADMLMYDDPMADEDIYGEQPVTYDTCAKCGQECIVDFRDGERVLTDDYGYLHRCGGKP